MVYHIFYCIGLYSTIISALVGLTWLTRQIYVAYVEFIPTDFIPWFKRAGVVHEITPQKDTVWKYLGPKSVGIIKKTDGEDKWINAFPFTVALIWQEESKEAK